MLSGGENYINTIAEDTPVPNILYTAWNWIIDANLGVACVTELTTAPHFRPCHNSSQHKLGE